MIRDLFLYFVTTRSQTSQHIDPCYAKLLRKVVLQSDYKSFCHEEDVTSSKEKLSIYKCPHR